MDQDKKRPTILLVDEDRFLLGIYAGRLNSNSWDVSYAASAEEAINALSSQKFEVVVLDVMVGNLPGVEILKIFKDKKLGGVSATIILSNNDDDEDVERARRLGADGYIVKAHNTPAEVIEEIERIYKARLNN